QTALSRPTYEGAAGTTLTDFVLLKRKKLARLGWPMGALLVTVVRTREGVGHALLTVRTDQGELVLDNRRNEILAWNKAPYLFQSRQSAANPKQWAALDSTAPPALFAGFGFSPQFR
ncbi:transglutaminase-like cysteine peptidase, partial [Ancylobacter lacus]|uniref:transglutaminase-like cysteine peptidase n=1 Tax=Ancylobacter lacus TaxID=2579970 RepID=UPI001BCDC849